MQTNTAPMTLGQFLWRLERTPRTWRLHGGEIRNACGQCPYEAVADLPHQYGSTSRALALVVVEGYPDGDGILGAADHSHHWGDVQRLQMRGLLLGACGLLGSGWTNQHMGE